jgi:imidazolonepropionase-like amidohydrolase
MALVLRGATLIDGTGAAPRANTAVTLTGDRIVAVESGAAEGAGDAGDRSAGDAGDAEPSQQLDLTHLALLPGLINAHAHLGMVGTDTTMSTAEVAARVFRNCELALAAGFTSVRELGGLDGGVARAIERGLVRGPRVFPSGPALAQEGGHGTFMPSFADCPCGYGPPAVPGLSHLAQVCNGPDAVRLAARTAFRRGATQLKVFISGGVVSLSDSLEDTQFVVEELRAIVAEAQARHTYVTAHAHNSRAIRNGLAAGIACFEHGSFLDEETAILMAQAGAALVPTFAVTRVLLSEWQQWGLPEAVVGRMAGVEAAMTRATRLAYDKGVSIGSGADLLGAEQNRHGLELVLKARILGPMAAIVSATSTNARIMRVDDRLGTVAPGKLADLIAVTGDPLTEPDLFDDPTRVVLVIKGGQIVKDTRG